MKQRHREKGFTAIEGILIAIAVLALAFGAWWIWQKNRQNNSESSTTANTTQNESSSQPTDPSEGGKYLVIKEWGVRFLLPEELRGDIYYKVGKNDITKLETASFASNELDNLLGDFSCSFKENPKIDGLSAGLIRLNSTNRPASSFTDSLSPVKILDEYEYFVAKQASPPITCLTGQREDLKEIEYSTSDRLRESFKTIEIIE